jgi:hypothetical protein
MKAMPRWLSIFSHRRPVFIPRIFKDGGYILLQHLNVSILGAPMHQNVVVEQAVCQSAQNVKG